MEIHPLGGGKPILKGQREGSDWPLPASGGKGLEIKLHLTREGNAEALSLFGSVPAVDGDDLLEMVEPRWPTVCESTGKLVWHDRSAHDAGSSRSGSSRLSRSGLIFEESSLRRTRKGNETENSRTTRTHR